MSCAPDLKPRVYLAGPDVFYPDARERGRQMQALCAELGLVGLYPLDGDLSAQGDAPLSLRIYQANRQLIQSADAVVANLRDFRGCEPDSGTVWEASFALALGKPVVGYLPRAGSLLERMAGQHQHGVDAEGCTVEDFGLPLNLMLAHSLSAVVVGPETGLQGLRAALERLRGWLPGAAPP
ncbi:nucleoside 2-deoxyribosyltransferase [Curvibacter sp. HBC61]|uniref:Nucleoside 2-deoxyribosyltransferase n=1 Tax=Curvibacter cyanobacteriorum TaxID=3026422 RepID=A0ABT5MZ32_9BURK|nr:nucleoside 2-deoxyribosyltransferase [Curvibacter sp. HBC61]MDD0838042.1 nucleoside 2-deoxyribosyltransferase [Curvibacter sp. HBC61]